MTPVNRLMILECLLENSSHIHIAAMGGETLAFAIAIHPDLMILDVGVPSIDGLGIF